MIWWYGTGLVMAYKRLELPDDIDVLKALLIAAEPQVSAQNATLTERDVVI